MCNKFEVSVCLQLRGIYSKKEIFRIIVGVKPRNFCGSLLKSSEVLSPSSSR